MCRLTVYKGRSILLGDLIIKPENSLIRQSRDAHYHPGVHDMRNKRNILVNGDGFGVAWYVLQTGNEPIVKYLCGYGADSSRGSCVFKFITPAWSNNNLRNLGDYIYSNLIMAHVRAASSGHDPLDRMIVSNENCHPFKYGRWTFMHNGGIADFDKMKKRIIDKLSEDCFLGINGNTDSEYIFALFLTFLRNKDEATDIEDAIRAVEKTIATVLELCIAAGIKEPCSLNMVISDGINVIATRYRNGCQMPPSLYYKYGSEFTCQNGRFDSTGCKDACEVVISSAPLSGETEQCVGADPGCPSKSAPPNRCEVDPCHDAGLDDGSKCHWTLIPKDNMLVCLGDPDDSNKVISVYLKSIRLCSHLNKDIGANLLKKYSSYSTKSRSASDVDIDNRSGTDSASGSDSEGLEECSSDSDINVIVENITLEEENTITQLTS